MSRKWELGASSGSHLKMTVHGSTDTPVPFPGARQRYLVGVCGYIIRNIDRTGLYHIVLKPSITAATYCRNGRSVMALKTIPVVRGADIAVDLTSKVEYFLVDMTGSDSIQVQTLSDSGDSVSMDGVYILDFIAQQ